LRSVASAHAFELWAAPRSLGGRALSLPARSVDTARFDIGGTTYALTPSHAEVTPSGILVSATLRADEGPSARVGHRADIRWPLNVGSSDVGGRMTTRSTPNVGSSDVRPGTNRATGASGARRSA
jgi:hypothetical protein